MVWSWDIKKGELFETMLQWVIGRSVARTVKHHNGPAIAGLKPPPTLPEATVKLEINERPNLT